jgi:hypothetical protein
MAKNTTQPTMTSDVTAPATILTISLRLVGRSMPPLSRAVEVSTMARGWERVQKTRPRGLGRVKVCLG